MITLFVIVVIATMALAVTRAEGMRPLGLALIGMISLVLGVHATAIFTETSIAPLVNSIVSAQENTEVASPTDATDQPAESPASATPKPDEPVASEPVAASNASETAGDGPDVDPAPAKPAPAKPAPAEPDSEATAAPADPRTLSAPVIIEPITNVEYLDRDEDTPAWLETKPWSKDGVHFVPVVSRLQISAQDRDAALKQEIKEATNDYINELLKNKHATTLLKLRAGSAVPKVTASFEEQVIVTAGTMHQSHALLAFDDDFHDAIAAEWDSVRATSRLMQTGLGAGIIILLLSTMFSYFKLDTATRGYYTGRLQFLAAAAILAVIAVSVLFANYVPWM